MIRVLDLMEPEETVGNLWHDWASRTPQGHAGAAVGFEAMRASITALFHALGGAPGTEIVPAPASTPGHRRGPEIGAKRETAHVADFSGERLRLPPEIDVFPSRALNRSAYLWLAALAATVRLPAPADDPLAADMAELAALAAARRAALARCPGLGPAHAEMCAHLRAARRRPFLPAAEARVEAAIAALLGAEDPASVSSAPAGPAPRGYRTWAPVPILLRLVRHGAAGAPAQGAQEGPAPALPVTARKSAKRENRDQANRRDSFIIHRFEAIMSWARA